MDLTGKKLAVADFELGKTLGTGSFGRVRFVTYKANGNFYALKILKKSAIIRLKQVDHITSEKNILVTLKHPFIVNMFGCFHDQRYLYLLLEYVVGGEFFTHLRKAGRFPDEYIAPEVLLNKGHGKPVDWWTLGILVYEMIVGYPPFVDEDPMGIYQKILSGKIVFPKFFDKNAKVLVKKLLTADPGKRFGNLKNGVDDIKGCKWFSGLSWQQLLDKEITAPYKPVVKSATDTSNFEEYPDSDELPPVVSASADPFADW